MATYSNYYINGSSLQNATAVYSDIDMTILAPNGLYSNGVVSREQTVDGLGPSTVCPTCSSVMCEHNISINPTNPCRTTLDYNMGSSVGAIKVTVFGLNQSVVGIGIKQDANGSFNTFSSTGDSGYPGAYLAAQGAANVNNLTYFYANSFKAPCLSWDEGIDTPPSDTILETYSYNPTSGLFIPTGIFNDYYFTYRIVVGLASTVGNMVSYIPSSAANNILRVTAVYPCSPQPKISVECPTLLYDFQGNLSLNPSSNPCNDGLGSRKLVHGKVRGTVDGEFVVGDYIFTTNTLGSGIYDQLADGGYKSLSAYFPSATSSPYCSFNVNHGVITSISNC
jgi:hypothetical protein